MTCSNCQGKVQYKGANGLEYTCGKCRIAELEAEVKRLDKGWNEANTEVLLIKLNRESPDALAALDRYQVGNARQGDYKTIKIALGAYIELDKS